MARVTLPAVQYAIHISWVPELLLGINCIYFGETETNLIIKWNKIAKIATNFPVCKNKQTVQSPEWQNGRVFLLWFSIKSAESTVLVTRIFVILTTFIFLLYTNKVSNAKGNKS